MRLGFGDGTSGGGAGRRGCGVGWLVKGGMSSGVDGDEELGGGDEK